MKTAEQFVAALKVQTSDSAVDGVVARLEKPSGRRPHERLIQLASWYSQLDPSNRRMLALALKEAAESAVFGFLCVLDGARAIENSRDKGHFELYFVKGEERTLLNGRDQEELHNLFNGLRDPRE